MIESRTFYALPADMRVLDCREAAALAGLSHSTFRRLIARGEGPPVARLSVRRVGIRVGDLREWLERRVERP